MRQQQRSATFKSGEAEDHMYAVAKVYEFLYTNKKWPSWFIDIAIPVTYPPIIRKQLPKARVYDGHTFDLGIYQPVIRDDTITNLKLLAVIEINGNVGYKYLDGAGKIKKANPTKHSKELQKRNDKINKNYCENAGIMYKTLLKEEINGDIEDEDKDKNTLLYMQRELLEFLR